MSAYVRVLDQGPNGMFAFVRGAASRGLMVLPVALLLIPILNYSGISFDEAGTLVAAPFIVLSVLVRFMPRMPNRTWSSRASLIAGLILLPSSLIYSALGIDWTRHGAMLLAWLLSSASATFWLARG